MLTADSAVALALALLLVALWASERRSRLLRWAALAVAVGLALEPAQGVLRWVAGWFPL